MVTVQVHYCPKLELPGSSHSRGRPPLLQTRERPVGWKICQLLTASTGEACFLTEETTARGSPNVVDSSQRDITCGSRGRSLYRTRTSYFVRKGQSSCEHCAASPSRLRAVHGGAVSTVQGHRLSTYTNEYRRAWRGASASFLCIFFCCLAVPAILLDRQDAGADLRAVRVPRQHLPVDHGRGHFPGPGQAATVRGQDWAGRLLRHGLVMPRLAESCIFEATDTIMRSCVPYRRPA